MNREDKYGWEPVDAANWFKFDDFVNINNSFEMVRYNPRHQMKVMRSQNFDFYRAGERDYYLYDFKDSSLIHPFSVRALYSKKDGNFYELTGSINHVQQLNARLKVLHEQPLTVESVKLYLRFFFDHVSGRHGHFYICESYEEIKEAVDAYYSRPTNSPDYEKQVKKIGDIQKKGRTGLLRKALEKAYSIPSRNGKFLMTETTEGKTKEMIYSFYVFYVFKNAFFHTRVNILNDPENNEYGQLSMTATDMAIDKAGLCDDDVLRDLQYLGYRDCLPPFIF